MSAGNSFARACRYGGIVPKCRLLSWTCWCTMSIDIVLVRCQGHAHVIARSAAFESLLEGQAADAPWHVSNAGCLEAFSNAQHPTVPDIWNYAREMTLKFISNSWGDQHSKFRKRVLNFWNLKPFG